MNNGADFVQVATLAAIVAAIGLLACYTRGLFSRLWHILVPIYLVFVHALTFYVCIIWFPWDWFEFTHWSRWLRLHEFATSLLILYAIFATSRRGRCRGR